MNNGHLESCLPMQSISDFIADYADADRQRIAFAWNGKHAADFEDANQAFRWQVVEACLALPENASSLLLEHLFQTDVAWSREAWGAPKHFAQLGSVLLTQGKESVLDAFANNFPRSFDTYAASHHMQLAPELLSRLILHTEERLAMTTESTQRKSLEAHWNYSASYKQAVQARAGLRYRPARKSMTCRWCGRAGITAPGQGSSDCGDAHDNDALAIKAYATGRPSRSRFPRIPDPGRPGLALRISCLFRFSPGPLGDCRIDLDDSRL